ncbi:hypothetical protein C8R43DRAFT_1139024 [Mycena crocata]|nr:hypothetical protein C8R43DRAFT_1139024 [Mycena crocata]
MARQFFGSSHAYSFTRIAPYLQETLPPDTPPSGCRHALVPPLFMDAFYTLPDIVLELSALLQHFDLCQPPRYFAYLHPLHSTAPMDPRRAHQHTNAFIDDIAEDDASLVSDGEEPDPDSMEGQAMALDRQDFNMDKEIAEHARRVQRREHERRNPSCRLDAQEWQRLRGDHLYYDGDEEDAPVAGPSSMRPRSPPRSMPPPPLFLPDSRDPTPYEPRDLRDLTPFVPPQPRPPLVPRPPSSVPPPLLFLPESRHPTPFQPPDPRDVTPLGWMHPGY